MLIPIDKHVKNETIRICRTSLQLHFDKKEYAPEDLYLPFRPDGIFVTLWKHEENGPALRGCIGRHQRRFERISEEIKELTLFSALEDPRFLPVMREELNQLKIEVSFLSPPERVSGPHELNPQRYGAIIKNQHRQATLLPEIEGVDTVEKQLAVLKRKAGILPHEEIEIFRFTVVKIKEE